LLRDRKHETNLGHYPALKRLGFIEVHRKESHVKVKHAHGRIIVFPFHDEVDRYTLKGALRDADVDLQQFLDVIR
jgi:predicted RNA binding protein YcfA (HicA-like mRNA interferase family)